MTRRLHSAPSRFFHAPHKTKRSKRPGLGKGAESASVVGQGRPRSSHREVH